MSECVRDKTMLWHRYAEHYTQGETVTVEDSAVRVWTAEPGVKADFGLGKWKEVAHLLSTSNPTQKSCNVCGGLVEGSRPSETAAEHDGDEE